MSKGGMCLSVGLGWVGEKSVWGGGGGERAGARGGFKLSTRGRGLRLTNER